MIGHRELGFRSSREKSTKYKIKRENKICEQGIAISDSVQSLPLYN